MRAPVRDIEYLMVHDCQFDEFIFLENYVESVVSYHLTESAKIGCWR